MNGSVHPAWSLIHCALLTSKGGTQPQVVCVGVVITDQGGWGIWNSREVPGDGGLLFPQRKLLGPSMCCCRGDYISFSTDFWHPAGSLIHCALLMSKGGTQPHGGCMGVAR